MELLFEHNDQGYSWHYTTRVYLLTEEEYKSEQAKLGSDERLEEETFKTSPKVINLDGWHQEVGSHFEAKGLKRTIQKPDGFSSSMSYAFYDFYTTKDRIQRDETTKSRGWWG